MTKPSKTSVVIVDGVFHSSCVFFSFSSGLFWLYFFSIEQIRKKKENSSVIIVIVAVDVVVVVVVITILMSCYYLDLE